MTETNLNQEEEVVKTTPANGSDDSEDSELDDLFADDSEESEKDVATLTKEIADLKKGLSKFFSEQGRKAKQETAQTVAETKPVITDDVSELFYAQIPTAELVQSDLKAIADAKYGGSILKAWKGESWIQDKAKALADEKTQTEANKEKISKPSNGVSLGKSDFSGVKTDADVEKLTSAQRAAFMKEQVAKGL